MNKSELSIGVGLTLMLWAYASALVWLAARIWIDLSWPLALICNMLLGGVAIIAVAYASRSLRVLWQELRRSRR